MPNVCAVPNCRKALKKDEKCSIFQVPQDEESRRKWVAAIPGIKRLKSSQHVCERHFESRCIVRKLVKQGSDGKILMDVTYKRPRLLHSAVPSIFEFGSLPACENTDKENCISDDGVPVNETPSSAEVFQHASDNIKIEEIEVFYNDSNNIQDDSNDNETEIVNNNMETESGKMCRFCMKKTKIAKHIFEDYIDENEPIYLAVNDCLYPLMVLSEDQLSKYICNECLNTLSSFVKFRDFVLSNDSIQREHLRDPLMSWGAPSQKRDIETEIEPHILKKRKIIHRPEQCKLTNPDTEGRDISKENIGPDQQNNSDSSVVAPILRSVLQKNVSDGEQDEGTKPKTILEEYCMQSDDNVEGDTMPKTAVPVENSKQSDSKVEMSNSSQTTCDNIQFCLANGYLMEHKLLKGNLRYLKCALAKCPAVGTQEVLVPGVFVNTVSITKKHNHEKPTEIDIKKQKFISVIRKKLQNAKGSSLRYIYDEVSKLDPELAQLVPLKELSKEICNL